MLCCCHTLLRINWAIDNPLIEKVTLEVFANNPGAIALYNGTACVPSFNQRISVAYGEDERFL
jgi:hypothetical protein